MKAWALVAAILVIAATATAAVAHTKVKSRSPAKGTTVSRSVSAVKVTFNQQVRSGALRVYRGSKQVSRGAGGRSSDNVAQLRTRLKKLGRGGTYTARWRINAADGHTQRGSWKFKVR